jgi:hypothetical protein
MLLDVAYVHEVGDYFMTAEAAAGGQLDLPPSEPGSPVRSVLKTNRVFASVIFRFSGLRGPL